MIRYTIAALLSCFLVGCVFSSASSSLVGQPAPITNFYPIEGGVESTASYQGKVLVLAFWDVGCRHCRAELPKLDHLAQAMRDREDFAFLAISVNENYEQKIVQDTIREFNLQGVKLAFSGNGTQDEAFILYRGELVPYFVVIGKDGKVLWNGHSADGVRKYLY